MDWSKINEICFAVSKKTKTDNLGKSGCFMRFEKQRGRCYKSRGNCRNLAIVPWLWYQDNKRIRAKNLYYPCFAL